MKSKFLGIAVAVVGTSALLGCGGGAKLGGGSEGAAQALYQASTAAFQAKSQRSDPLTGGITGSGSATIDVTGKNGGTAKVEFKATSSDSSGALESTVTYNNFSIDGKNTYNGSLTTTFNLSGSSGTASAVLAIKGRVTISGEVNDFLDADVKQTVTAAATGQTSGTVTVTLDGTIQTSTQKYTYANQSLTVTVDAKLPVSSP